MVKMIVTILMAIAPLATAGADKLTCAIDGASAIEQATNAGVFIYASSLRCDKENALFDDIKCSVDVLSVAQSVNAMANVLVGAVDTCGDISTKNAACGQAAGKFTAAVTGLGADTAGLAHWIKEGAAPGNAVMQAALTKTGKCVMNLKGIVSGILGAASSIKAAMGGCGDGGDVCAADSMKVMSVLSNMGAAIAHSVTYCASPMTKAQDNKAYESGDILAFFAALNDVSAAAIGVSQACKVEAARLYEMEGENKADATTTVVLNFSNSLFLPVAFIPVAALLGFMGGRRVGKARQTNMVVSLGDETDV